MILRQGPLSLEEIQAKEERRKRLRSHTKFVAEAESELRLFFLAPRPVNFQSLRASGSMRQELCVILSKGCPENKGMASLLG